MKFTRHFLFLLIVLGTQPLFAQLSSRHYLPPLKRAVNWQTLPSGQAIYLSTPETTAFDVNVYQGTSTIPTTTLSISNSSPQRYEPPIGTGGDATTGDNNTTLITPANAGIVLSIAGLRFESPSGKKFYVNWRTANTAQASSLVSAGEAGLGTDFRWGGTKFNHITTYNILNSVIGIMATEDNTSVTISGYNPGCTFTKNNNTTGVNSITADVITFTLNAGQTFVLEAAPTGSTAATSPNTEGWLGATISSDKKIAVNQGHIGLSLSGNQDMSMTQITPTSNIGKEYVFIRGLGDDIAEFPVIIATENNTEIYVNNEVTPIATLNNGQWIQIPSSKYSQSGNVAGNQGANMFIKASKNVYAFQTIAVAGGPTPATLDVFQVAPLNCLLDNGVNKIPDIINSGRNGFYLTSVYLMLMASSAINPSNIIIKHGTGSVNTVSADIITNAKKTVSGTNDWVTYFVPSLSGDVSVYAPGPVAVAYLGINGAVGVAGYFSGFGSIPIINVETTGNGCFPNTTLTATPGFTTYAWYKDGVLMPSVTTNTFTPTVAGDYYVVVYNGFCTYPSATKSVYDCNPEVVVKNTASKKYLLPGESTTFTISVKLLGGSAAQNLQISNVLPAHLTFTSSTVTKGTFTGSGSNYTWNVGTMTNGEENILKVVATAQSVTSAYSENYITNNTQTFALGTETDNLSDDKTENVVIYSGCSSSLAGTILGAASYCTSTNTTTLTSSDSVGVLQWQSSTDNTNFTNIIGETASTLVVTNLASSTYYRVQATVDNCIEYSASASIVVLQGPAYNLLSVSSSDVQTLCVNSTISPITYTTTNTLGASFSGLPAGVSGNFSNNTITISGAPTVAGTFNYSILLTSSNCGSVNATGTITVNQIASVSIAQVLVVAGGGSGGVGRGQLGGAGGGAGGVVFSNNYPLSAGIYNVTVGSGGTSITTSGPTNGNNGADSVFGTLTAVGGGGGGSDGQQGSIYFGLNGGSGGGSAVIATSAGSSIQTVQINETTHYGNAGGMSTYAGTGYPAAGGGGAGHAGYTPNLNGYGNYGGDGGEGVTISFSSGSPTGYFAAGGGGSGGYDGGGPTNRGIGGSSIGGSGDGLNSNTATSGVTNTGSGGGGSSGHVSGAGGSGVVIIQYLGTPIATGGTISQSNGYTIHTFTSSGIFSNGLAIASSPQTLCQNTTATAITSSLSGVDYTYQWYSNNTPSNAGGAIINGATLSSYTPSSADAGTRYYYIVVTNSSGCSSSSAVSGAITITANNTADVASSTPTLCINTSLTNITHTTTGATGIGTATGLPAGVTAAFASNTITISGTPTVAGAFNYSIPLTGGSCGSVNATGTITINPTLTVNVTINGDLCINKTTLTADSGMTSYTWYKDNIVISGATSNSYIPTTSGDYKVQASDGTCGNTSATTTISVCGLTADGQMIPVLNSTTLVSKDGATNSGKGIDERGLVITKPIYYGTVTSATGRIWLDRNLGASRVALSSIDTQAYGDYYQWGRPADGHQTQYLTNNNSTGFTNTKSTTSVPPNSLWIEPTDGSNDWLITPDNTLWAGANPTNNPCPAGFRIPTESEWNAERATWSSNNAAGAFASPLKLTRPGMLTSFSSGGAYFTAKNNFGQYQTQSANTNGGVRYFGIEGSNAWFDQNYYKSHGMSCRCIKD